MTTPAENKRRLDNHSDRLRDVEVVIGRNGLVSKALCDKQIATMERRMDRVERQAASMSARVWALLVLALSIAIKLWLG